MACVLVACAAPAGALEKGKSVAKMMSGRQQFEAKMLQVGRDRVALELADPRDRRSLLLPPDALRQLRVRPDQRYGILAVQRLTPGGIFAGARMSDGEGLYAIAESIRDVSPLTAADRNGIAVKQLPDENRIFVYEDECGIVYNVPTRFTIQGEPIVLQAYQSKKVRIGGVTYTLNLNKSQFVVQKDCPVTFEGAQARVDYTLVRD